MPVVEPMLAQSLTISVCITTKTPSPPDPQGATPVLQLLALLANPVPVLRLNVSACAAVQNKITINKSRFIMSLQLQA
jgi:hypothetical protein